MSKITLYSSAENEVRRLIKECFPCNKKIYEIKTDNIEFEAKGMFLRYVEQILKENGYSIIDRYGQYFKLAKS